MTRWAVRSPWAPPSISDDGWTPPPGPQGAAFSPTTGPPDRQTGGPSFFGGGHSPRGATAVIGRYAGWGPGADRRVYGGKSGILDIPTHPSRSQRTHRLCLRRLPQMQLVFDIDAQMTHRCFYLGVTNRDLHSSQAAGLFVNECSFASSPRMGSKTLAAQADPDHAFLDEANIWGGAEEFAGTDSARGDVISTRPVLTSQPSAGCSRGLYDSINFTMKWI